eukprot:TRINITY_DN5513_c0_g1_i1.p1 TRINITY_DN5513_c0_g1~~TRINITY_DN5513_c0_g1_i1.p1  ORF type:complete len:205 (+),score=33.08 TRINITY_DN5513_c0_g1_i1:64-678(+)
MLRRMTVRWMSRAVEERLVASDALKPCIVDATCVYSKAFRGLGEQARRGVLRGVLEGIESEIEDGDVDPETVMPKDIIELEWCGIPQVEPCHAKALVDDGHGLVVDVREQDEIDEMPLASTPFLHIPLSRIASGGEDLTSLGFPDSLGTSEDNPCLLLCKAGIRSQRVAEHLHHLGRSHVANITGGIQLWHHWEVEKKERENVE